MAFKVLQKIMKGPFLEFFLTHRRPAQDEALDRADVVIDHTFGPSHLPMRVLGAAIQCLTAEAQPSARADEMSLP